MRAGRVFVDSIREQSLKQQLLLVDKETLHRLSSILSSLRCEASSWDLSSSRKKVTGQSRRRACPMQML
jgi:hypothetical protein